MADYVTLDELKDWLNITDDLDDDNLSARITAASRQVDEDCNRPGDGFGVATVASARVYKPMNVEVLLTDDISTTTGLVVEVGWSSSYSALDSSVYELRPENCHARGVPGNVIARIYGYWPVFYGPLGYVQQRVRVTALWGWPSVPAPIKNRDHASRGSALPAPIEPGRGRRIRGHGCCPCEPNGP
jgi:hypothetical protein